MNPFDLEAETFRILFKSHYELAGKFDEAAGKVVEADKRLSLLLAGEGAQGEGLLGEVRDAKEALVEALEELRQFKSGYLEQQITALNAQIEKLPSHLLGEFSSKEFVGRLQSQVHGMVDERIVAAHGTIVKMITEDLENICADVSIKVFGDPAEESAEKQRLSRLLADEMKENRRLQAELDGSSPAAAAKLADAKKRIWVISWMTTFTAGVFLGLMMGSTAIERLMPYFN